MIKRIKSLFKKKIALPLWFFILNPPVKYEDFEEYNETLERTSKALLEGKNVILKINSKPAMISKVDSKISVRFLEKDEYKIVW